MIRANRFARIALRIDRATKVSAVSQSWLALQFASEELQGDREIVVKAVSEDGRALRWASDQHKACELSSPYRGREEPPEQKSPSTGKKKSIHHHRGNPPFSLLQGLRHLWCIPFFPDLWCIPYSLVSQANGIHRSFYLLCDLGVGRQTEKGGVPWWWCILFSPLHKNGKIPSPV